MGKLNNRFLILILGSASVLSGCSAGHLNKSAIPEGGLTVSEIYNQTEYRQTSAGNLSAKARGQVHYYGLLGQQKAKLDATFKPLANPAIPIHVFPHVALIGDEQIIKPGYTTAFFLYKQNQFALASELY